MHELWLCRSIMDIIDKKIHENNITRVKKVYLEIGQLAAVEKLSLILSFQVITQGTKAENANLEIIDVPGVAICESCKKSLSISKYDECCQTCGNFALNVVQGEELRIKSMEVE